VKIGVVFVSTGGNKMTRALRSFRRTEPDVPVHIAFATSSRVWESNSAQVPVSTFESQPNVLVRLIHSTAWINGCFNLAISWMRELGYDSACIFHDDIIFSPLPSHLHHITGWFDRIEREPELQESSGLTLSFMEALVPSPIAGHWHRSPEEWNAIDLESEPLWNQLCPNGRSALYFGSEGSEIGVQLSDWFVKYFVTERIVPMSRLGPSGKIIPISIWEEIGGYGETEGIFYDMEYPVICALRGLPPVKVIPNIPHIHLHNQTTGYGDPAEGLWGNDLGSFIRKYGKEPGEILQECGYYDFKSIPAGDLCPEPNLRYWLYGGKYSKERANAAS
jgi:hypothetical protein